MSLSIKEKISRKCGQNGSLPGNKKSCSQDDIVASEIGCPTKWNTLHNGHASSSYKLAQRINI